MIRLYASPSPYAVKNYFNTADYYAGESVGFWGGKLAPELGLEGPVTKDPFGNLADNINPKTGKRLTLRTNAKRIVGDDIIFSLPKDVGAFIMLLPAAERDRLLAMVEHKASEVMGVIEADVETRVRKEGKDETRPGDGLVWGCFFHPTARPVDGQPADPHPHWHFFCFNATRDNEEGGRIKAANLANIYRDRPYYQTLFFSKVAAEFKRLGLPVVRRPDGTWGLAELGSLKGTFSKRTDGIEDVARQLNITDPAVKGKLGGKTRNKKDKKPLSPEQSQDNWLGQLTDGQRGALARVQAGLVAGGKDVTAAEAVEFAIAHCSEKLSVIPERELKRVALLFGIGSVTPEEIDRELRSPRHGLIESVVGGRRCVTTEALQAEEGRIAAYAAAGVGKVAPVGVAGGLTRTLADGRQLSDDQFQAVTDLLTSPNRVNLVQGPAGAGKSSLLAKFDEGARLAGQHVTYLGTTGAAVGVLEKDGFDAGTVASFIGNDKLQAAARGGRVVVDETSILCHKDALKLIEAGKKNDLKFVFVGDPMQHGSIGRGAFMRLLTEHGSILPFRLTKILRQKDADYRAAAQLLSEGKTAEGFDALDKMGWVRQISHGGDRHSHMAADYVQSRQCGMAWDDILAVCPTHAEAARVTQSIRSQLRDCGKLSGDEHEFTRLVAVDTSEAERGQAMTYRPGEVIQFHRKSGADFAAGDRLVITDPAEVPLSEAGKFSVYRQEQISLAKGDVIRFTAKVKTRGGQHEIRNGEAHVIAGFTDGGNIRLNNGWIVGKDAGHFRHGYVETSIGSQGRTVRRVLIDMTAAMGMAINMQQLYVSASRAWDSLLVYCDDKPAVRDAARRDSRQLLALDLKAEAPGIDRLGDDAERQRRLARQLRPFIYRPPAMVRDNPPPPPPPTATPPIPSHGARVLASLRQHGHAYGR
jgi:conjugative relaxase-like TrwC/TraI family protein